MRFGKNCWSDDGGADGEADPTSVPSLNVARDDDSSCEKRNPFFFCVVERREEELIEETCRRTKWKRERRR